MLVGLGLSLSGMVAAVLGALTPVQGALLQEAIDVALILDAMRVLAGPGGAHDAGGRLDRACTS
ncbi:hypothetical protein SQ03_12835 [Methylobacterium platani JCM 14648]|uniref:Uncharacterized protein n=2 Tax=Methylobacterium platani TaxID=427683 RepID=A0A179SF67_9HYPH|nr:hypothetical protein SQ03_12835 [Methylobacterium platani JCM 14648]OAS25602.1 hypothetical protein A5481_09665 [Methylobacterium platani]